MFLALARRWGERRPLLEMNRLLNSQQHRRSSPQPRLHDCRCRHCRASHVLPQYRALVIEEARLTIRCNFPESEPPSPPRHLPRLACTPRSSFSPWLLRCWDVEGRVQHQRRDVTSDTVPLWSNPEPTIWRLMARLVTDVAEQGDADDRMPKSLFVATKSS
jgi:hypothetical protein